MADKPASEQTEAPTPERLRKARQEGRIPQSQEVPSAVVLGMFLIVLALASGGLYQWFVAQARRSFTSGLAVEVTRSTFTTLLSAKLTQSLVILVPFLVAGAIASIGSSLLSSGWALSTKAVKLNLGRISPVSGMKNMLSMRSVVRLLISIAKLVLISLIVTFYLKREMNAILALRWASLEGSLLSTGRIVLGVLSRVVVALAGVAAVDLLYQRWNYKRQLRMTRQEVKEERKQYELAPEVKQKMRAVQFQMARKRMLQDVGAADVVLANPTHVAVAIKYDGATMDAPTVVAKGPDLMAKQIKEMAAAHGVPVVHRPELARAVYRTVEVGGVIPETLFVAVAEVLAMIYRLRSNRISPAAAR